MSRVITFYGGPADGIQREVEWAPRFWTFPVTASVAHDYERSDEDPDRYEYRGQR